MQTRTSAQLLFILISLLFTAIKQILQLTSMALALQHEKSNPLEEINEITDRPNFANPISKATFEALPKIYGTSKKKKYVLKYSSQKKQSSQPQANNRDHSHRMSLIQRSSLNKTPVNKQVTRREEKSQKRFKTQMKSFDKMYFKELSRPRKEYCGKKNCFCCKICSNEQNKSIERPSVKLQPTRKIKLPQIQRNGDLDEVETRHKVSLATIDRNQGSIGTTRKPFTLLDLLKSSERTTKPLVQDKEQKDNAQSIMPKSLVQSRLQKKEVQIQFPMRTQCAAVQTQQPQFQVEDNLKGKTEPFQNQYPKKERQVESSNSNRSYLKQRNQQDTVKFKYLQNGANQDKQKLRFQQLRAKKLESQVFDSESEDSRSIRSSLSSASISKYVFQGGKQTNTMFHSLKNKETSSVKQRPKSRQPKQQSKQKFIYQKKNGLFVIPEQDEYVSYLKGYEPMNEKFNIKNLIRKPDFKVVKQQEGIYFGQFKDQIKNGRGILVTDRHIFEGHYTNNLKNYGCQRNADGVYKGQYVNGVREGYGTFEWNNGEIFEGQWKNGTKNGYGIWKSPKGDYYEGNWKLNRQHGKGIYKHKVSTYRGHFVQFLKDGEGEQFFVNGDKYIGSYSKGKPNGFGKYTWADGSYYQGEFQNGVRQGKGKWVYNNGTIYEGQFKSDFKQGYGKQTYKSGEYFEGTFAKGARSEGSLYDAGGNEINITQSD